MDLILAIGIILIAGFIGGSIASRLGFPRITGYLIIGIFLNSSAFPIIPKATLESLNIVPPIVLGIISYHIGGGLRMESVRELGKTIAWVTLLQSMTPWLLTLVLISCLGPLFLNIPNATFNTVYFPMALILSAIAVSSAPAAIVAIIHECKAQGPVTTTCLAVLALTDALAVFVFAIALGIGKPLTHCIHDFSFWNMLSMPLFHIFKSAAVGLLFGFVVVHVAKLVRTRAMLLVIILGIVILCIGIAEHVGASSILASMVIGFIAINGSKRDEMLQSIEEIEEVIFTFFSY